MVKCLTCHKAVIIKDGSGLFQNKCLFERINFNFNMEPVSVYNKQQPEVCGSVCYFNLTESGSVELPGI